MEITFWAEIDKGKKASMMSIAKLVEQKCNVDWVRNGRRALDLMVESGNRHVSEYLHSQGAHFTLNGSETFMSKLTEGNNEQLVCLFFFC